MTNRLAVDGGTPIITESIPGGMHGPSMIDDREIDAVYRGITNWKNSSVLLKTQTSLRLNKKQLQYSV